MKMTIETAMNTNAALGQFGQKKLPFQMALTVATNLEKLQNVAKEYDKRRMDKVRELGKEHEETGQMQVAPENQAAFTKWMNDLVEEEIEIKLHPINTDALGSDFEVEPNILVHLKWLFS